jgi:hypothetical protein
LIDVLLGDTSADNWRMYVPALRAKASEWKAFAALTPGVRRRIAPIIEFVPHWKEPGANASTRKRWAPQTPAEYVQRFLESCATATPSGTRSFVYFGLAGSDAKWSGIDLWSEFEARVPSQLRIVPLADLGAAGSSSALARVTRSRREVGLRFERADIGPALASRISGALQKLGVSAASAHLFVDLKDAPAAVSHAEIRAELVNAGVFAAVVVLAGVFPPHLMKYSPDKGRESEPRSEWSTWLREHHATPRADPPLGFGDYTTQCAHYAPSPEMRGSVSLRYTMDDEFLVFRGRRANSGSGLGNNQIHGHCILLVRSTDYAGAPFSSGDQRLYCWTDPTKGPGNPEQWRIASLVHHITNVVVQLQDPTFSSATFRAWARGQVPAPCP